MRIVIKHTQNDTDISKDTSIVTAHVEMEDGSGEKSDPVEVTLGQQVTFTVTPGSSTEAYLDDTQVQAVID